MSAWSRSECIEKPSLQRRHRKSRSSTRTSGVALGRSHCTRGLYARTVHARSLERVNRGMPQPPPAPPPPALPPRRPPPAAVSPNTAIAPQPSSSTSMLRTRALAKVNRIAHQYVAPRLESAANSASTRLNNWRERETTSEPEPGPYTYQVRQPKKAAGPASSSSSSGLENWSTSAGAAPTLQNSDYPRPYAAGSSSSSRSIATSATTSSSERTTPSRKWTASGLGSYLHLGSYSGASTTGLDSTSGATLASSSGASTTTGSKGKGKATAAGGGLDDIDEDKILCFPGVSFSLERRIIRNPQTTKPPSALL